MKDSDVYYVSLISGALSSTAPGTDLTGWTEAGISVPSQGALLIAADGIEVSNCPSIKQADLDLEAVDVIDVMKPIYNFKASD